MCRSLWALGGRKKRQCLGLSGAAEKADLKSTACAMHMSAEGTVGTTYLIKFRETLAWGNPAPHVLRLRRGAKEHQVPCPLSTVGW